MALQFEVGGQQFPLVPGSPPYLRDPIADALLDFLSYYLNDQLRAQLTAMTPKNAEAVPTDAPNATTFHRHAYDPGKHWPQNPLPSLYIWRKSDRKEEYTTVQEREVATYGLMYIAQAIRLPVGGRHYAGIGAAVSRIIRHACDQGFHPDYGYNGGPTGEQLHIAVGFQGWEVAEMQTGMAEVTPGVSGAAVDFYPIVSGTFHVWSVIGQPLPQEAVNGQPGNMAGDMLVTISTSEEGGEAVEFLQGYLSGPDGSEDGDE